MLTLWTISFEWTFLERKQTTSMTCLPLSNYFHLLARNTCQEHCHASTICLPLKKHIFVDQHSNLTLDCAVDCIASQSNKNNMLTLNLRSPFQIHSAIYYCIARKIAITSHQENAFRIFPNDYPKTIYRALLCKTSCSKCICQELPPWRPLVVINTFQNSNSDGQFKHGISSLDFGKCIRGLHWFEWWIVAIWWLLMVISY